jgi:hypothetical protein
MKVGDQVAVLDDIISGVVIGMENDDITMETTDGFEMTFTKKELVVTSELLKQSNLFSKGISNAVSEKEDSTKKRSKRVKPKDRALPAMIVDLHIQQLIPNTKGLDNYDMLTIQMDTAKRQLEFAMKKRIQRLVFIHGVGEGVLRTELEFLFKRYDTIKYYDADFQKYGRGATEIYIFQSKTTN